MIGQVIHKLTGSGNDFVFVDGRTSPPADWSAARIRAVCARGTGVGADGVVILEPGSVPGAVRFHYFNADGSRAAMCGNAALCATRLAAALEMAPADAMCLETDAGPVRTRCVAGTADRSEIEMGDVTDLSHPEIPLGAGESLIAYATVGIPHLVILVEDIEAVDIGGRGKLLRCHPAVAPAGANANFVAQTPAGWTMRTYERGVEAETLACGTGAVASAATLAQAGLATLPLTILSRSGRPLVVSGSATPSGITAPRLDGEGRMVFRALLQS